MGVARRLGCSLPLRDLRLAAQRHLSLPPGHSRPPVRPALVVQGRPGPGRSAAARRDLPPATADLPGPGSRPECVLRQLAGPVPASGPVGLRGGGRHPVAGCVGGGPGRAPDPQAKLPPWVEVDETWLSIGGAKRPVAVVLGPKGERLDLRRVAGSVIGGNDRFCAGLGAVPVSVDAGCDALPDGRPVSAREGPCGLERPCCRRALSTGTRSGPSVAGRPLPPALEFRDRLRRT